MLSSDDGGRYAYSMQPEICKWNCLKLAQSLNPIVGMEDTRPLLEHYDEEYSKEYTSIMRKKVRVKCNTNLSAYNEKLGS